MHQVDLKLTLCPDICWELTQIWFCRSQDAHDMRVYVKTCVKGGSADRDGRIMVNPAPFCTGLELNGNHPPPEDRSSHRFRCSTARGCYLVY